MNVLFPIANHFEAAPLPIKKPYGKACKVP